MDRYKQHLDRQKELVRCACGAGGWGEGGWGGEGGRCCSPFSGQTEGEMVRCGAGGCGEVWGGVRGCDAAVPAVRSKVLPDTTSRAYTTTSQHDHQPKGGSEGKAVTTSLPPFSAFVQEEESGGGAGHRTADGGDAGATAQPPALPLLCNATSCPIPPRCAALFLPIPVLLL